MSKINLSSKSWADLIFEGRNKEYGAYRMRANLGKRQLRGVVWVAIAIVAIFAISIIKGEVENAIKSNLGDSEQVTELSQLKKEEPKKEEKKQIEKPKEPEQPKAQEVQVRNTIQLLVRKIVDDNLVDRSKELKSQKEISENKAVVGIKNVFTGTDEGKFTEDLKQGQVASNRNTPPVVAAAPVEKKEVLDNSQVDVQASFPGGDTALRTFIGKNTKYPEIAQEQGLQGVVKLRFKVDTDGSVSAVTVRKSLSRECDAAAIDVFKKLPRFTPAKMNGKPVPVWFTMDVRFQLQ